MRCTAAISTEDTTDLAVQQVSAEAAAGLQGDSADLALCFVSIHHRDRLDEIVRGIQGRLAPRVLLGCTAEGVIGGDQEVERSAAISLWAAHLPEVKIATFHLTFRETDQGIGVMGWPAQMPEPRETPLLLLLAEPFSTPGQALLAFLNEKYPQAPAVGGMASGGMDVGMNLLILNDQAFTEGVVGVALTGPVQVRTVVSQGCRPIGERFIVTKAEGNLIQELGGRPALERLQEIYTALSQEDQRLARQALHVGCAMNEYQERFERGDFLIKNLMGADNATGAIALTDVIQEGQTVQFHVRDGKTASEDLHHLLKTQKGVLDEHAAGGALLFSCNGRGRRLFGTSHHDISTVQAELGKIPVAGFFAQGEIGPIGGKNFLHGFTASVALFCQEVQK